jgi:hypothetical protein
MRFFVFVTSTTRVASRTCAVAAIYDRRNFSLVARHFPWQRLFAVRQRVSRYRDDR